MAMRSAIHCQALGLPDEMSMLDAVEGRGRGRMAFAGNARHDVPLGLAGLAINSISRRVGDA